MLIIIFSLTLRWLPPFGLRSWQGFVLPVIVLAVEQMAIFTRVVRGSTVDRAQARLCAHGNRQGIGPPNRRRAPCGAQFAVAAGDRDRLQHTRSCSAEQSWSRPSLPCPGSVVSSQTRSFDSTTRWSSRWSWSLPCWWLQPTWSRTWSTRSSIHASAFSSHALLLEESQWRSHRPHIRSAQSSPNRRTDRNWRTLAALQRKPRCVGRPGHGHNDCLDGDLCTGAGALQSDYRL